MAIPVERDPGGEVTVRIAWVSWRQTFFDANGSPAKARHEYVAWYAKVLSRLKWNGELRRFEVH